MRWRRWERQIDAGGGQRLLHRREHGIPRGEGVGLPGRRDPPPQAEVQKLPARSNASTSGAGSESTPGTPRTVSSMIRLAVSMSSP